MLNIVLVEPEIPQNTGNISPHLRGDGSAAASHRAAGLFHRRKHLRRAGLDYWDKLELSVYPDMEAFYQKNAGGNFYYFSTKAEKVVYGSKLCGRRLPGVREGNQRACRKA